MQNFLLDKMAKRIIAIDSSQNLKITGLVSAISTEIDLFYNNIDKILKQNDHNGEMHWRKIPRKF